VSRWLFAVAAGISPLWWGLANLAVSRYEGWGQWAAAPLLLLPLGYSLLVGLAGIARGVRLHRRDEPLLPTLVFTLIALLPWLLLILRKL